MASVSLTISRAGRPVDVHVLGEFGGTPTGDCVAQAVAEHASFRAYKGAIQTFTYPFVFREGPWQ
jgi:hypothetical protein